MLAADEYLCRRILRYDNHNDHSDTDINDLNVDSNDQTKGTHHQKHKQSDPANVSASARDRTIRNRCSGAARHRAFNRVGHRY